MSTTSAIHNNPLKVVDHCDVDFNRGIVNKLITNIGLSGERITYSIDNSRSGNESTKVEFTNTNNKEVILNTTIRSRKYTTGLRVAVSEPQTYKSYHLFMASLQGCVDTTLYSYFETFFSSAMDLTRKGWVFESEQDVIGENGYFTFSIESRSREHLLQVSVDVVGS